MLRLVLFKNMKTNFQILQNTRKDLCNETPHKEHEKLSWFIFNKYKWEKGVFVIDFYSFEYFLVVKYNGLRRPNTKIGHYPRSCFQYRGTSKHRIVKMETKNCKYEKLTIIIWIINNHLDTRTDKNYVSET